jgi:signal transduction histidine kinase
MTADDLLQIVTQALYVLIFGVVAAQAINRPTRSNLDIALLFGDLAVIIITARIASVLHFSAPALTVLIAGLLMAVPYLTLRLVDDFAGLPTRVMRAAELGLALSILAFIFVRDPLPAAVSLPMIAYFTVAEVYAAAVFVRQARTSNGLTQRRMTAVAAGSLFLGLTILMSGASIAVSALADFWTVCSRLFGLLAGIAYYLGFAPPSWLRRAWQEPELRRFLGRAAQLPRLPTTEAIIEELERGAAASLGAPHASIGLWNNEARRLRFPTLRPIASSADSPAPRPPAGESDGAAQARPTIAMQAYETQRPVFVENAPRQDPERAETYRAFQATALLVAPITAGDRRLGVLTVYAPRSPIFAGDDLVLVKLLADQAAVVLESRMLIDEAARVQAREEATRLKDDFLSSAAHDLKTPLTTLMAQTQLMERRAERDPAAPPDLKGIRRLVDETRRLSTLVIELLDASRVEQGRLAEHREPVDLAEVVRDVCQRHSEDRHTCVVQADRSVVGQYDRARIGQLVDNLIENARKYSPNGGQIQVDVWGENDEARLSVADHGIGISQEDLQFIFDRYQRGRNVDDRRFAGMGLGLYICQGIVKQHGGRIWATSAGPDQGATFHVVLPLEVSRAAA